MNIDVKIHPITCSYTIISVIDHTRIKDILLPMIDSMPSDNSNPDISKVDWALSEHGDRPWISFIKPILDNYMKILGDATGYENCTITDLWFQQYIENNQHDWHVHGQQMVGVYYLELPEDSPITELVSPFLHNTKIVPDVKEGDILVFPSEVVHRAPKVTTGRKTILSWNFHWEAPHKKTLEIINTL